MLLKKIKDATNSSDKYRKGIYKDEFSQLVIMSIKPGQTIPETEWVEIHSGTQYIFVTQGKALLLEKTTGILGQQEILPGDCVVIPPSSFHGIINIGKEDFKFYTIYCPVEHPEL